MAKRRLKTMEDLRRYIANLINRVESGEVPPELSGRLGYLCNILSRILIQSDIEKRLEALETEMKKEAEK
ncbi:MAG: hypothetical protein SWH61_12975 [Thermodesulfobacteriota bacterium]|nr:hypothetical protein [Thermodesulfobacteriota bacterium]